MLNGMAKIVRQSFSRPSRTAAAPTEYMTRQSTLRSAARAVIEPMAMPRSTEFSAQGTAGCAFLAAQLGKAAVAAVERHGRGARADEDDGLRMQDVVGVAQEKFHAVLFSRYSGRFGQPGDLLSGDRRDFDQIDAFAFGRRPSGRHDRPGEGRYGFRTARSFVYNHNVRCFIFRIRSSGRALPAVVYRPRRVGKPVHSSIATAPSER